MINRFLHWITHLLKRNTGKVVTWQEDGYIFVGFKCDCGKIDPDSVDKIIESDVINEWYSDFGPV